MSPYRESIDYFSAWLAGMIADPDVHIYYQGSRRDGPFFRHGTYRNYEIIAAIAGRFLMMYTDGAPTVPDDSTGISVSTTSGRGYENANTELIGHQNGNGIYLAVDPRYIRFVTLNSESGYWEAAPTVDGDPNPCEFFLQNFRVEEFFRQWRPPTLEDVMTQTWVRKREMGIATAHRRLSMALANMGEREMMVEEARMEILSSRATLSEWGHMTLEKFMESINRYRDQLESISSNLTVDNGKISIILGAFETQGVNLGPYKIEFEIGNSRVRVYATETARVSRNGHPHPHVTSDGAVCWGQHTDIYNGSLGNPFEALFLTAEFLKTGYYPSGAYCRLDNWAESNTFFCEYCSESHNNDIGCSAECAECSSQVNWGDHSYCTRHFLCFSTDRECSGCAEENNKRLAEVEAKRIVTARAAAEAEAEAKRLAGADENSQKKSKKITKKKATKKKVSRRRSIQSIPTQEEAAE